MISHDYQFIFIHVPKCAGTSMEAFLEKHANASKFWLAENGERYRTQDQGLTRALNLYPNYRTFAFTRNPFDRFVSAWKHSERGIALWQHTSGARRNYFHRPKQNLSLKDYAYLVAEDKPENLSVYDRFHTKPQTDFILDYNKDQYFGLERQTTKGCDFIGRFENLDQDFTRVCQILGLENDTLPFEKSSWRSFSIVSKHYSSYYDSETVDVVSRIYADDLQNLNYAFERKPFDINFLKLPGRTSWLFSKIFALPWKRKVKILEHKPLDNDCSPEGGT